MSRMIALGAIYLIAVGGGRQVGLTDSSLLPSGAISGTVIESVSKRPLGGVMVQLGKRGSPGNLQLTDDRGRFVFTKLADATYSLTASLSGFADGHYGPVVMGAAGGGTIRLAAGEWFSRADIQVARLASISGFIVDERGEAVVNAYVRVVAEITVAGGAGLAAGPVARTDDRGHYRIANLPRGKYIVVVPSVESTVPTAMSMPLIQGVSPEQLATVIAQDARPLRPVSGVVVDGQEALVVGGYVPAPPPIAGQQRAYPITFYPNATSLSSAGTVELESGSELANVDFALLPAHSVNVSGRLEGPISSYEGYVLRLMPAGLEELGEGSEAATTTVRPDGSFRFLNVPEGSYTLEAPGSIAEFAMRSPVSNGLRLKLPGIPGLGRAGDTTGGGLVSSAPAVSYNAHTSAIADLSPGYVRFPVTVGSTDVSGLIVPLERTGVMRCTVSFENTTGSSPIGTVEIVPADGRLALGAHSLVLDRPSRGSSDPITLVASAVVPGDYVVRPIGMPSVTLRSVTVDGEDVSRRSIHVASGQDVKVAIVLTGERIALSGVIRDSHGSAVPLASAIAFPVDARLWANYGLTPTWIRESIGSNSGAYELTNLRAGDYYLVGVAPSMIGAWTDPEFLKAMIPHAMVVSLSWGSTRSADLEIVVSK
jgi:hypothetical protein